MKVTQWITALQQGDQCETLQSLYSHHNTQRYVSLLRQFQTEFGDVPVRKLNYKINGI